MEAQDPLIGAQVGPCRVEALMGRGGMGVVYRGRHLALDRDVAVKLVEQPGEAARAAILAEARAAAKLDDPRIVGIYEVGEHAGRPYIIMQWVEGETLEARVSRDGPLSPEQALSVMKETLAALAVAHGSGLVHRDVKPGNILLPAKGGVKLADFGLAVPLGCGGEAVGTFLFMAPEQGYGQVVDARADLYAVGGTWHYALTGKPPFGLNPAEALLRHRDEAPPDTAALRPGVTRKNAALIGRLLAKTPQERPASAADVLKECLAFGFLLETASPVGDGPFQLLAPPSMPAATSPAPVSPTPVAPPPPPPPPPPSAPRHSRALFGAIMGVFVMAAVGGSFYKARAEDWVAASVYFGLVVAALTFSGRQQAWRKPAAAAAWALSAACAARYAGPSLSSVEAVSLAGLGGACGLAGAYLGLWGRDRQEVVWARILASLGSLMLAAAAVTWGAPESQDWSAAFTERAAAFREAFAASGGPWRWLGAVVLSVAVAIGAKLRPPALSAAPKDRRLNWNR